MSDDYCELILTCDTREQDKNRVQAITDFFESHGGVTQNEKLDHCDYKIEGIYKEKEVNLGIETKVLLGDFFPSLDDMPGKFFKAYQEYHDVALFIEEGNYSLKLTDDGLDAWVQSPAMQAATGAEGIGKLSMYNNFCGSMAESGIHVRTFRTVNHFPVTVSGLLKNIVKPVHRGIAIQHPDLSFYENMMNVLAKFPGVGAATAEKGLKYIPNLDRLISMSLEDFQSIFGQLSGKKLYHFITNPIRKEECSKAWEELYTKNAPKRREKVDNGIKANKKQKDNTKLPDGVENSANKKIMELNKNDIIKDNPVEVPFNRITEWEVAPRVKDVIEYIRQKPRSMKEITDYFGFTQEYGFKKLMEFKLVGKIWFENSSKTWQFGSDRNPEIIQSEKPMEIGV